MKLEEFTLKYIPWNLHKTNGFLMFLGITEIIHWLEIGQKYSANLNNLKSFFFNNE